MGNRELNRNLLLGKIFESKNSGPVRIIEYRNFYDVLVEFLDTGNVSSVRLSHLKNGKVRDKGHRTVFDIGYIFSGRYTSRNSPIAYMQWRSMLGRCYNTKLFERNPSYIGCSVSDTWHNFQSFAEWHINQIKEDGWELDKDIIKKGNKVYCPEYCALVPHQINTLFLTRKANRGDYPIGVQRNDSYKRPYLAMCNNGKGSPVYLGSYDSVGKAFAAYKFYKEDLIKRIAEKFKTQIDPRIYYAMMNFEVEITD